MGLVETNCQTHPPYIQPVPCSLEILCLFCAIANLSMRRQYVSQESIHFISPHQHLWLWQQQLLMNRHVCKMKQWAYTVAVPQAMSHGHSMQSRNLFTGFCGTDKLRMWQYECNFTAILWWRDYQETAECTLRQMLATVNCISDL